MNEDEAQKYWNEYYKKRKNERMSEASQMQIQMNQAGVTSATVLALDFVCFGRKQEDINELSSHLSGSYNMTTEPTKEDDYFLLKGTTRPEGINLEPEQHMQWVDYIFDVVQSYSCVFTSWSLESPELKIQFNSEEFE